jgi:anaerobic magnesium-protoporphyrin IX monomethyl ester cyclase
VRLLLISCRSPFLQDDRIYPPLGLLYLKSAVQREVPEARVTIVDDYDLDDLGPLADFDVVGVSVMTPQRAEARRIVRRVKARWPDKVVVAGGPHVLHYTEDMERDPWDHLVRGDGERDLPRILRGEPVPRISREVLPAAELASMPPPDRLGEREFLRHYHYRLGGLDATTMLLGRGCPMACKFCEDARTTTRWTSLANAERELSDIVELGYRAVYLFDDLFAINLRRCAPYLELLKAHRLRFRCNVHARFMTDEFAAALAEAGCVEVAFGAESGSQAMLDRMDKRTTVAQNYACVAHCKRHGLTVKAFLMIGLPGETRQTIAETERFLMDSGVDDAQIAIYYPYRGTRFRREMDEGAIADLVFEGEGLGAYGQRDLGSDAAVRTPTLTSDDLLEIRRTLITRYRLRSHLGPHDHFFDQHLAGVREGA